MLGGIGVSALPRPSHCSTGSVRILIEHITNQ